MATFSGLEEAPVLAPELPVLAPVALVLLLLLPPHPTATLMSAAATIPVTTRYDRLLAPLISSAFHFSMPMWADWSSAQFVTDAPTRRIGG
jgi:hypothetical protein